MDNAGNMSRGFSWPLDTTHNSQIRAEIRNGIRMSREPTFFVPRRFKIHSGFIAETL